MKDNMLEVGDSLYYTKDYSDNIYYAGVIDRVTKTIAFIGKTRLKRHYRGLTTKVGDTTWNKTHYYLLTEDKTEELKQQSIKRRLIRKINEWINSNNGIHNALKNLDNTKLIMLLNVLQEDNNE